MRGKGTLKLTKAGIEISGYFENQQVNGKGTKKWKRPIQGQDRISGVRYVTYVYRGGLRDGNIEGKGEFRWPDGRHYIGDF
jgi:hypothetical protein